MVQLIGVGIVKGKPLAEQWWRETARPLIDAKRAALRERRTRRKAKKHSAAVTGPSSSRWMRWMRHRSRTDRACRVQRHRHASGAARRFRRWYVRNLPYALSPALYAAAGERIQRDIVADPQRALDPEGLRELELYFQGRPRDDFAA